MPTSPSVPRATLFPLAFSSTTQIDPWLAALGQRAHRDEPVEQLSAACWSQYDLQAEAPHALVLVAQTVTQLKREVELSQRTWADSWHQGIDWRTPAGSVLAAEPQGPQGKIAFVYPGIGSIYLGFASGLLDLFSAAIERMPGATRAELEQLTHPELLHVTERTALTLDEQRTAERRLHDDIVAQAEIVVSLAYATTHVLRTVFALEPQYAFGNSLGELAMYASLGTWKRPIELSARIRAASVFRTILHGPMTILENRWRAGCDLTEMWEALLVTASLTDLREALKKHQQVFLAEVHTASQGVIAGKPSELAAVVRECHATATPLPFQLVYHCPVVRAIAAELESMYTLDVGQRPQVEFLSLTPFTKVPHDSRSVAQALVNTACHSVDFPPLVEGAYDRGTRVFVEIGPRQNCTSWVKATLSGRPHLAVGLDQKGVGTQVGVTRALAALLSHRVDLCTAALREYC